jgi:hypothetical protein
MSDRYVVRYHHDAQRRGTATGISFYVSDEGTRAMLRDLVQALRDHESFNDVRVVRDEEVEVVVDDL